MADTTLDTERVISEVRQRPELWDLTHNLYKDRDARQKAWTQICETLYPDFTSFEDQKKKDIEKIVGQRWKTARDAYMRCKNTLKNTASGSGGGKKKVYVYYDEMKFLDKKHDVEVEDSINTAIDLATSDKDLDTIMSNKDMSKQVNSPLVESRDSTQSSTDANIYIKPKNVRKRKHAEHDDFDKEMMAMFKDNAKLFKNDDLTFFMSLLPLMEKFSMQQKLIFRSEVLKKAMEIGSIVNPYDSNRSNSSQSCYSGSSNSNYTPGYNTYQGIPNSDSQDSVNLYVPTALSSETQILSQGYQTIRDPTQTNEDY